MNLVVLAGITVSLAMDAFSVCIAAGTKIKRVTFRHYFRLAFHFGLFQFLMPIIGFYCGVLVMDIFRELDHWIAFGLLGIIGVKMMWESFSKADTEARDRDPSRGVSLIILSIATSIDALAVGFSLAALQIPVFAPAVMIGIICMAFSVLGVFLGCKLGCKLGRWAERLGGVILISIGIKILVEHLLL